MTFSLRSISDGSFLCMACDNVIYDLRHDCPEMLDDIAEAARNKLNNTKDIIIAHEINENS